jgi:predicted SpoU family rRNA methylase
MGGMTVVMTGEFETLTRDQVTDIVKRYGGKYVLYFLWLLPGWRTIAFIKGWRGVRVARPVEGDVADSP